MRGMFLDPRSWKIDFLSSPLWAPSKFGVNINLYPDAFNIAKERRDVSKYSFALATEVWEIPMRKTLDYLRSKGLKVFLIPREPFKTGVHKDGMFGYNKFLYNNEYYFTPDLVLSPGQAYSDLWEGRAKTKLVGHPRCDFYMAPGQWPSRDTIAKKHGLDPDKKTIFFPSYPPYYYKKVDGKDTMQDIFEERETTIAALEEFTRKNKEYQAVIKIHPMSFKCFKKGSGSGKEVSGLLKRYYTKPEPHIRVIGDIRTSGMESKELLIFADIVIGFTSTMLLEAALVDKSTVHVLFGKTAQIEGLPEYADFMPTAYNSVELQDILAESSKQDSVRTKGLVNKYIQTGTDTCKKICEAIKQEMK